MEIAPSKTPLEEVTRQLRRLYKNLVHFQTEPDDSTFLALAGSLRVVAESVGEVDKLSRSGQLDFKLPSVPWALRHDLMDSSDQFISAQLQSFLRVNGIGFGLIEQSSGSTPEWHSKRWSTSDSKSTPADRKQSENRTIPFNAWLQEPYLAAKNRFTMPPGTIRPTGFVDLDNGKVFTRREVIDMIPNSCGATRITIDNPKTHEKTKIARLLLWNKDTRFNIGPVPLPVVLVLDLSCILVDSASTFVPAVAAVAREFQYPVPKVPVVYASPGEVFEIAGSLGSVVYEDVPRGFEVFEPLLREDKRRAKRNPIPK